MSDTCMQDEKNYPYANQYVRQFVQQRAATIHNKGRCKMKYICIACGKEITEKDTIGINKKLLGNKVKSLYCMPCLADYLGTTVEDLNEKIEEFKEEGCKLFS